MLALGEHDTRYVDAYHGPASWREQARREAKALPAIEHDATMLQARIAGTDDCAQPGLAARCENLRVQLAALRTRAQLLQGLKLSFDEEARRLYQIEVPHYEEADFKRARARIEKLLPGEGALAARYQTFIDRFALAPTQIEPAMRRVLAESRARSRRHLAPPDTERIDLLLVRDQPWSAYNWYLGSFHSRIELNTELPIDARNLISLATHEGYPGHHLQGVLREATLLRERGWVEYGVFALYTPQAVLAEGAASMAMSLSFTPGEVRELEREITARGDLDRESWERYAKLRVAMRATHGVVIEVARRWLDGEISRDEALRWLQDYALLSPAAAEQRLRFIAEYRSYIATYSVGASLVRDWLQRTWWAQLSGHARWQRFAALFTEPITPADLRRH